MFFRFKFRLDCSLNIFLTISPRKRRFTLPRFFILEPVAEVFRKGGERFCRWLFEVGNQAHFSLKVLEEQGLHEILLSVLAFHQVLVLEIDLHGDIGGRRRWRISASYTLSFHASH